MREALKVGSLVALAALHVACNGERHSLGRTDDDGAGNGGEASGGTAGSGGNGGAAGRGGNAGTASGGTTSAGATSGGATSSGAGGTLAGSGNPGGAPNAELDIGGDWAMFSFEDPVAVHLEQEGNLLTGRGCCAGLPAETSVPLACCGVIEGGSIDDGHARFGFSFDDIGVEVATYSADVRVSADGKRMLGSFSRTPGLSMAWVRLERAFPGQGWLASDDASLKDSVARRANSYTITTRDAGPYAPGEEYSLVIAGGPMPTIRGDLGPFWAGEMSWSESDAVLTVGPVPVTDPSYPIGLRLFFEGDVLRLVEAEMPSGPFIVFGATPN